MAATKHEVHRWLGVSAVVIAGLWLLGLPTGHTAPSQFSESFFDTESLSSAFQQPPVKIRHSRAPRERNHLVPFSTAEEDALRGGSREPQRDIINTLNGPIQGFSEEVLGIQVQAFLGIPFAKPPLGDLRFRKPVPVESWTNTLNATELPNACMQEPFLYFIGFEGEEMWNPNTNVSEDCLYLNIWTPKALTTSNTPSKAAVLVWIYGGGFMAGSSALDVYDGKILAAKENVIVVSINYRLGAFGFLCLGIEDAPCNQGLWDITLGMEWLRDNVQYFGGDPELITVFGESAGGSCVSALFMSPNTEHLAKRGILQSGTLNAPWSYLKYEDEVAISAAVGREVGCNQTLQDPKELVACMRGIPAANISVLQWSMYDVMKFPFAPTIEGDFLKASPIEALNDGRFKKNEIMIGSNRDEGTYFLLYDFISIFNKDNATVVPKDQYLKIMGDLFPGLNEIEFQAVAFQYTDWEQLDNGVKNQRMIAAAHGDYNFICPTNFFAQSFAKHGADVYYYYFTHRSSSNKWGEWMGIMHADEIEYVFGRPLDPSRSFTGEERALSERIMHHYATFARTGKPVEPNGMDWPRYTRNDPQYFIWNTSNHGSLGRGPRAHVCAFWNEFMPELRRRSQTGEGFNYASRDCEGETPLSLKPREGLSGGGRPEMSLGAAMLAIMATVALPTIL